MIVTAIAALVGTASAPLQADIQTECLSQDAFVMEAQAHLGFERVSQQFIFDAPQLGTNDTKGLWLFDDHSWVLWEWEIEDGELKFCLLGLGEKYTQIGR